MLFNVVDPDYFQSYQRYSESVFSDMDKLIRKSLDGISASELSAALPEVEKKLTYIINGSAILKTVQIYLSLIFMRRGDSELLTITDRILDSGSLPASNITFADISKITILSTLMYLCLNGSDKEMCKKLIDKWINGSLSETATNIFFSKSSVEFIYDPLYPLMITNDLELTSYFLNKAKEKYGDNKITFNGYIESAICFRSSKFLKLICNSGYDPMNVEANLLFIISDRKNLIYFSEIINDNYFSKDRKDSVSQNLSIIIPAEKKLYYYDRMFENYGEKGCSELFNRISYIDVISEKESSFIMNGLIPDPFECKSEDMEIYIREKVKILSKYTAKNIKIILDDNCDLYKINDFLECVMKDKSITYELSSEITNDNNFFDPIWGAYANQTYLINFFRHNNVIFNSDALTQPIKMLLKRNSKELTNVLLKKGAVSENFIGETIEYLVENNLLISLSQVNNYFQKHKKKTNIKRGTI